MISAVVKAVTAKKLPENCPHCGANQANYLEAMGRTCEDEFHPWTKRKTIQERTAEIDEQAN